jgi:ABC-type arginine transport system permease subunit
VLIPILIIALNQFKIFRKYDEFRLRQKEILTTVFPLIILLVLFSYFAGGTLLTQDMKPVGISWWKLPAIFGAIQVIALLIGLYIPKLLKAIKARKSEI